MVANAICPDGLLVDGGKGAVRSGMQVGHHMTCSSFIRAFTPFISYVHSRQSKERSAVCERACRRTEHDMKGTHLFYKFI